MKLLRSMSENEEIEKINEKMDTVLKVLQDFGLDVIQNMGGVKHSLNILVDQVNKLNENLLNLKSIGIKLDNISKIKEDLNSDLKYIQSLIIKGSQLNAADLTRGYEVESSSKELLLNLKSELESFTTIDSLISEIESVKEGLFSITGGHRVLFEITSEIKNLKKEQEISETMLESLGEKITVWINKIDE